MLTRRRFLRSSTALAATAVGFPHVARPAEGIHAPAGRKPRHIIQLVADGMSMGTLTCGDHLAQLMRAGRGLSWIKLNQRPDVATAWVNMRSLNSLVTDSAAASSSWGSGSRVINGAINQLPNGTSLKTLYELFNEIGWKRGLVTTTEITHATPAGFAANVDDRETGNTIAVQYLERKVDVLLGGGQKFFDPKERKDKRDLRVEYRKAGYSVMEKREQLLAAPIDQPWLGIFDKSHLPFTVDHLEDPKLREKIPTLAEMTTTALKWLEKEEHFILQVEGGRVDQGCHNCDAVAALRDQIAFDEALDVCLEFQRRVPDTLLVITTDHGNGNLGLNGTGSGYGQSSFLFDNVMKVRKSFAELLKLLRKVDKIKVPEEFGIVAQPKEETALDEDNKETEPAKEDNKDDKKPAKTKERERITVVSTKEIVEIFKAYTGYNVPLRRAEMLAPFLAKKGEALYEIMKNDVAQMGQLMGNYFGIGWTGNAHTADYVLLTAVGPGAERFRGFIQNTDVFYHYLALADIDFRNPSEPLCADASPSAGEVENVDEYKLA